MDFRGFFEKTSSDWVRYSKYEYKTNGDNEYLTPTFDSEISIFNPLDLAEEMIANAINLGDGLCDKREKDDGRDGIMEYALKYGLLGFMTAIPLNEEFTEAGSVHFKSSGYFKVDSMKTKEYLDFFMPFGIKSGQPNVGFTVPPVLLTGKALEFSFVFSRNYAEPLNWLHEWFGELYTHFLSYHEFGNTDNPALKEVYARRIGAFRERGLGFQMRMGEKPVIVWEFNSLKTLIETLYAFAISDADAPLRMCKRCGKAFFVTHGRSLFCSERCRNQYNVYKHRANAKAEKG